MKKYLLILLIQLYVFTSWGQGFNTEFGKNRVQTKKFEWSYYKDDKFDVYYYLGGKDLAKYVQAEAEKNIEEIEGFFDFRLDEKISFILYNSQSDYNQSNMFLQRDNQNIGGTTRIIGNTAFIYYTDNHFDFKANMREGIAEVVLNEMLYGGSIQERLQNSTLLHLPEWYTKGLVQHIAGTWDLQQESRLRNGVLSGDFKKMGNLSAANKILVSHSIWEYIHKKYGKEAVANIVYVSRINKNLESGFTFVVGKTLADLYAEWYSYFYYRFLDEQSDYDLLENEIKLPRKINRKKIITQYTQSPNGKYISFVTNKLGKAKIWVFDVEEHRFKNIYKEGYKSEVKSIDESYPIVKWSKTTNELFMISEKKGMPFMSIYDAETNKWIDKFTLFRVDKVYSFNVGYDNRSIVLSGLNQGQSDIFMLDRVIHSVRPITNDDYDDKDADFIDGGSKIIFSSNRSNNDLKAPKGNNFDFSPSFDLYSLNIKKRSSTVKRLTYTDDVNEYQAKQLNDQYIIYNSDQNAHLNLNLLKTEKLYNGIRAIRVKQNNLIDADDTLSFSNTAEYLKYLSTLKASDSINLSRIDTQSIYVDTAYMYKLTSFGENIIQYKYLPDSNQIWFTAFNKQKYRLFKWNLPEKLDKYPLKDDNALPVSKRPNNLSDITVLNTEGKTEIENTEEPDSFDYYFVTGFEDIENEEYKSKYKQNEIIEEQSLMAENAAEKEKKLSRFYELSFSPDELVTQFDNSIINSPYLPYNSNDNFINQPSLNGMFKLAISDMFKDYRLMGGVRLSTNLRESDVFLQYDNYKKRLDKSILFFRRADKIITENSVRRTTSNEIRGVLKWPFSEVSSVRLNSFVREDRETYLATSVAALERDPIKKYWLGGKFEYVYDNVVPDGNNIMYGTRFKLYYEYYNEVLSQTQMHIIGGDFRHYLKIYKSLIWANRFAFASSMGQAKVAYFLGGVDNWLRLNYNNDISVDQEVNFVYKSLATNLRGWNQNIRNGASYAVWNSELRWPLVRTFTNKPIKSMFLENLQAIGFVDVGTAFNGNTPFSQDNAFNKRILKEGSMKIEVSSLREPIIGGYGFGFRSMLLGYFVRLDWAWGYEKGLFPERITYLSLGLDF